MPQLDTSTWFTTITSSLITLFILMQLKVSSFTLAPAPFAKSTSSTQTPNPWETKWTKIYSPLSLPPQ